MRQRGRDRGNQPRITRIHARLTRQQAERLMQSEMMAYQVVTEEGTAYLLRWAQRASLDGMLRLRRTRDVQSRDFTGFQATDGMACSVTIRIFKEALEDDSEAELVAYFGTRGSVTHASYVLEALVGEEVPFVGLQARWRDDANLGQALEVPNLGEAPTVTAYLALVEHAKEIDRQNRRDVR